MKIIGSFVSPYVRKVLAVMEFKRSTSIAGRRQALVDAGARLTAQSMGDREPRRGAMRL